MRANRFGLLSIVQSLDHSSTTHSQNSNGIPSRVKSLGAGPYTPAACGVRQAGTRLELLEEIRELEHVQLAHLVAQPGARPQKKLSSRASAVISRLLLTTHLGAVSFVPRL